MRCCRGGRRRQMSHAPMARAHGVGRSLRNSGHALILADRDGRPAPALPPVRPVAAVEVRRRAVRRVHVGRRSSRGPGAARRGAAAGRARHGRERRRGRRRHSRGRRSRARGVRRRLGCAAPGCGFACTALEEVGVGMECATGGDRSRSCPSSGRLRSVDPEGRGGFGIAGARTTLRPGPGPRAMPKGEDGVPSRRGISAPPATAIARRSAATTRSFRLMLFPPPADNIPRRTIGRRGDSLDIQGCALSSFKLKLVAYFVLLSLVPLAATYWGFSTVAGSGELREVTLRQEAGLRAALALYAEQADRGAGAGRKARAVGRPAAGARGAATAVRLGGSSSAHPSLYVSARGGLRVGSAPGRRRAVLRRRRHRRAAPRRGSGDDPARRPARRSVSGAAPPSPPATFSSCSRETGSRPRRRRSAGASPLRRGRSETVVSPARAIAPSPPRAARAPEARLAVLTRKAADRRGRTPARATGSSPACSRASRSSASSRTCRGGRSSATSAASPPPPAGSRRGASASAFPSGDGTSSRSSARPSTTWPRSSRRGSPSSRPSADARARRGALRRGARGDARREGAAPHRRGRRCRGDVRARQPDRVGRRLRRRQRRCGRRRGTARSFRSPPRASASGPSSSWASRSARSSG